MKKQISKISIFQFGKFFAVLYLVLSAIFLIPFGIFLLIQGNVYEGVGMLIGPLIYSLFSFIIFVISAFVYNIVADIAGGIEVTVKDID